MGPSNNVAYNTLPKLQRKVPLLSPSPDVEISDARRNESMAAGSSVGLSSALHWQRIGRCVVNRAPRIAGAASANYGNAYTNVRVNSPSVLRRVRTGIRVYILQRTGAHVCGVRALPRDRWDWGRWPCHIVLRSCD